MAVDATGGRAIKPAVQSGMSIGGESQKVPYATGFTAKGNQYNVRIYPDDGFFTYEVTENGSTIIERRRPPGTETEKQVIERIMGIMGA